MVCIGRGFLKNGVTSTMPGKLFDNVTFATYVCPESHIHKLYAPGAFSALLDSHKCEFGEIILVRQRCRDIDVGLPEVPCRILESEDYPNIYKDFHIVEYNPLAWRYSGHDTPVDKDLHTFELKYWWKRHTNQLIVLQEAHTKYIVFSDDDAPLLGDDPDNPWVGRAIEKLETDREFIIVNPGHGLDGTWGNDEVHSIMSLQVCLVERERWLNFDYETPLPEGVEWKSYHFMLEGRVWRYAQKYGYKRWILGKPIINHLEW